MPCPGPLSKAGANKGRKRDLHVDPPVGRRAHREPRPARRNIWLRAASRTADWRIGTEHEKFGYRLADLKPLPYEGRASIRAILAALRDRYGWRPVEEAGNLIGLEKDGANVSLEPGGQLELSGAPLRTIHETCDEVNEHLREVKAIADEIGAGFIGLGAAPEWSADRDAGDAQGPLRADDPLHAARWAATARR